MVIKEALELGMDMLSDIEYTDSFSESSYILSFLLKKDKSYIYTYIDDKIPKDIVIEYKNILKKRKEGIPLAYLLGVKYFYHRYFNVTKDVLIPRADTELIVDYIIDKYSDTSINVLELGVGSGIISITLAEHIPKAKITGVDISNKALEVAKSNIIDSNINLSLIKSDLYQNVESIYDIIVSNPPYINKEDMEKLQIEVRKEPKIALYGGEDGLDYYRKIISGSVNYLNPSGEIILEIGYDQSAAIKQILIDNGYNEIEYISDLQGYRRVVIARRN